MPAFVSRDTSAKSFGYHRIRNQHVAERIIASTGLAPPDLVFEFGAGDGQLTAALASRCRRLVCVEIDRALWRRLRERFAEDRKIDPVLADFMAYELPSRGEYKLVSNVPFGQTAALLRRIGGLKNPPAEAFLVLQLEAAQRWAGIGHETLASVLLKTRFVVEPHLPLHRSSFSPRPNVDCMVVRLTGRRRPLVPLNDSRQFEAFVRRGFGAGPVSPGERRARHTRPSELTVEDWVALFRKR